MAASTALSTAANPTQLCRPRASPKPVKGLGLGMGRERFSQRSSITCQAASSIPADRVPDMEKRKLMNLLLLGAISLPTVGMVVPYGSFFIPAGSGGAGGGTYAKDKLGNDIKVEEWLQTHGPNDRTLAQGLKGDPTYLVVEQDKTLATYGINAVCTHLGCVVPWNGAENKFICPCHGSQYNNQGKVVRGPAPLSLALVHADVDDGKVLFVPWVETDFRTGEAPWWKA
ncbi:cytochrome b6-f complex iron-sulfur subunit [Panicum miliaceum]|uniref:Cytochrome b6-f complex iron-sulfur subunit, chloroplastic n=1 Tax=Panicum miliaceum TaxID=4540 RepID=A0A3L6QHC1_PANMI|nr:cytochrome b6-f complex iron-sulfur subunit [Panicum miliaceum]